MGIPKVFEINVSYGLNWCVVCRSPVVKHSVLPSHKARSIPGAAAALCECRTVVMYMSAGNTIPARCLVLSDKTIPGRGTTSRIPAYLPELYIRSVRDTLTAS